MTTTTTRIWFCDTMGEGRCDHHAGSELTAAIQSNPLLKTHRTSFGYFTLAEGRLLQMLLDVDTKGGITDFNGCHTCFFGD